MQIPLARMQARLQEWALTHASRALWAGQPAPLVDSPADSHVSFQMIRPPHWLPGRRGYGVEYKTFPDSFVSLTLGAPAAGVRYGLQLNGVLYGTDAVGGDTASDVYDRLIALINADLDLSVVASNPGELRLTPDNFGDVWQLAVFPSTAWTVNLNTTDLGQLRSGLVLARVSVNVYAAQSTPRLGAGKLAADMIGDLDQRSWEGVKVLRIGEPQDLSAILAGTHFESRAQFNVDLIMQAVDITQIGYIDTINIDLGSEVGTIQVTI